MVIVFPFQSKAQMDSTSVISDLSSGILHFKLPYSHFVNFMPDLVYSNFRASDSWNFKPQMTGLLVKREILKFKTGFGAKTCGGEDRSCKCHRKRTIQMET